MPGVVFVLRRMNERRREALEDQQAGAQAQLRPLFEEFTPLNRDYLEAMRKARAEGAAERRAAIAAGASETEALERFPMGSVDFPDDKLRRWAELSAAIRRIEKRELEPAAMRVVVVSIEGLEIDGQPAGIEELLEDGPDQLRGEIAREVKRELGLLAEEAENLSSPSTSAAAVDGAGSSGSAAAAGSSATISAGDAGNTTGPGSASAPSTGMTP